MGVASVILGVLCLLFMFGGFFLSFVPFLGTVLSFAAPLLGLAGVITGGIALSRAKAEGQPTGAATGGIIVSVIAVIPAILVALTCGLCNACMSAGVANPNGGSGFQVYRDGGVFMQPDPSTVPDDPQAGPNGLPTDPNAPPPAFPPPPIAPPAQGAGAAALDEGPTEDEGELNVPAVIPDPSADLPADPPE